MATISTTFGPAGTFNAPVIVHGRAPASWPHRVGVVPPLVVGRLPRAVDVELRGAASTRTDADPGCHVLSGLGGVGKTQVAVDLAELLWERREIDLLVWVNASSRAAVLSRYAQAASEIIGIDHAESQVGADRFLAWLSTTSSRWLVVLDDLQVPADMNGLWPPRSRFGRTIVTTRRRDAALMDGRHVADVGVFTTEESVACVRRRLGDHPALLDQAESLAEDLGGLPLALAQAAAYMVDQEIGCADYRDRLSRRRLAALAPHTLPDDQATAVADMWSLSIDLANNSEPRGLAGPILKLAALLDPNAIPSALFDSGAVEDHVKARAGRPADHDDIHDTIRLLSRLSLLTVDGINQTVRMHALVQRAVREHAESSTEGAAALAAADGLTELWLAADEASARTQLLRGNSIILFGHAGDVLTGSASGRCHPLVMLTGQSLSNAGLLREAFGFFGSSEASAGRHLGRNHPDVITLRAELADLQGFIGDRARAVTAMGEVLNSRISVLGADHPDTLKARHDHAHWIGHGGDPARAITQIGAAIGDMTRVIGPDHELTLIARGNLAHWRAETGDVLGTIAEMESLLHDRTRVLGAEHPRTLVLRMSLAFWRGRSGEPIRARDELESLLKDQARVLGVTHPDVLATRSNVAHWQGRTGDARGAAAAFQALMADRLVILGPAHPRTMLTRGNLAHWIGRSGDPAAAVSLLEEVVADQETALGPTHRDVMGMRGSLAYWRGHAGAPEAAVSELEAVFADQARALGEDHADTRATRLALDYWLARRNGRGPATSTSDDEVTGRCRHVSE